MSQPRNYQTEAVVIRKTKLKEADRILTLYTPNLGKIQAVAKGVRRPRSKLAGHLELLTHSKISLARGRGHLDVITGSQTINGFLPLKENLEMTSQALYACELIEQFTADHIENLPLFRLLTDTLHRLSLGEKNELVLRYYELHLLAAVGYRPQLRLCLTCHQPLKPVTNKFSPHAGGVLCPDCGSEGEASMPLSVNALKVLRFLQKYDYQTSSRLKIDPGLSRKLEMVMRAYISHLLEREVKSATWQDSLKVGRKDAFTTPRR